MSASQLCGYDLVRCLGFSLSGYTKYMHKVCITKHPIWQLIIHMLPPVNIYLIDNLTFYNISMISYKFIIIINEVSIRINEYDILLSLD